MDFTFNKPTNLPFFSDWCGTEKMLLNTSKTNTFKKEAILEFKSNPIWLEFEFSFSTSWSETIKFQAHIKTQAAYNNELFVKIWKKNIIKYVGQAIDDLEHIHQFIKITLESYQFQFYVDEYQVNMKIFLPFLPVKSIITLMLAYEKAYRQSVTEFQELNQF